MSKDQLAYGTFMIGLVLYALSIGMSPAYGSDWLTAPRSGECESEACVADLSVGTDRETGHRMLGDPVSGATNNVTHERMDLHVMPFGTYIAFYRNGLLLTIDRVTLKKPEPRWESELEVEVQ